MTYPNPNGKILVMVDTSLIYRGNVSEFNALDIKLNCSPDGRLLLQGMPGLAIAVPPGAVLSVMAIRE